MFLSDNCAELFVSLSKAQAEFKAIPFDKTNPHFKNKYASLSATLDMIRPILSKYGLTILQSINTDESGYHLDTVLAHSSGQHIHSSLRLIIGKQDMQGLGSAVTYAKRYALQAVLGIAGDDDDDANGAVEHQKQEKQTKTKVEPEDFVLNLGQIKNTKLKDLPIEKLTEVGDWLSKQIKEKPKDPKAKFYGVVYGNVKKVLEKKNQNITNNKKNENFSPDIPPDFGFEPPPDEHSLDNPFENSYQQEPNNPFEGFAQVNETSTELSMGQEVIKLQIEEIREFWGKRFNEISARDLGIIIAVLEAKMREVPKIPNVSQVFSVLSKMKAYLGEV